MSSINKMVGGVLVALLAVGGLTACGQADASSNVSCDNATFSVAETQSDIKNAEEKVEESTGTPGEKSSKAELKALREQLKTLNACNDKNGGTTKSCPDTWAIQKADYGNTRWFANGIAQIDKAKTEAEARAAVATWLDRVKTDPLLLSAAAKTFLKKDVSEADLVTGDCGSDTAVKTVLDIETVVAKAAVKKVKSAPRGTVTTGVQDDKMVSTPTTGDDAAIRITLKDGTVIWLERDCGNVVTKKPVFPPDNPEKDCPPDMPHGDYPLCKDDPSKDPAQNGNAPVGGGRNEDSGPGTYIPPGDMDKPSDTPRTNPPPPSGGGSGGTPDPRPAPSPEPEAPKPSDPETGCKVIPNVEDCKG